MRRLAVFLLLAALPSAADVTVRLDAAAQAIVTEPQRSYYLPGPDVAAGLYWGAFGVADLSATVGYGLTPRSATSPFSDPAAGVRVSVGVRLHPVQQPRSTLLFLEASAGTVVTGDVPTFGFQAGVGALFHVGDTLLLGPRLGVQQIFRVAPITAYPSADATFASVGLSLELPLVTTVRDRDADDIADADDACPDTPGDEEHKGCPPPAEAPKKVEAPPPPVAPPARTLLRARLVDLDDKPVTGKLRFRPAKGPERTLEATPSVEVELPPGEYRFEAEAVDYLVRGRTLTLREGETLATDFVLRRMPKIKIVTLERSEVVIKQQINFEFGKSTILPDSFFILDEVTDIVLRNPQIEQLRIEGHTDDVGGAERNMTLSENRALAVVKYLVDHGVDASRISGQGFGLSKPLASNKTEAGRAKNRRVQFRIMK